MFIYHILAMEKDYQTIIEIIKRLHAHTSYKTFYELFNASEITPIKKIQTVYTNLLKSKSNLPNCSLSVADSKKLITNCFNILKKKRSAYNQILNSPYLMYDDSNNYKNSRIMIFASILALLLCFDLAYFCIRFVKYCKLTSSEINITEEIKDSDLKKKKKNRKAVRTLNITKPDMFIIMVYKKIMSIFSR
ncbi:hypothetical protein P3W45_001259 [Vairimorpha bombi]